MAMLNNQRVLENSSYCSEMWFRYQTVPFQVGQLVSLAPPSNVQPHRIDEQGAPSLLTLRSTKYIIWIIYPYPSSFLCKIVCVCNVFYRWHEIVFLAWLPIWRATRRWGIEQHASFARKALWKITCTSHWKGHPNLTRRQTYVMFLKIKESGNSKICNKKGHVCICSIISESQYWKNIPYPKKISYIFLATNKTHVHYIPQLSTADPKMTLFTTCRWPHHVPLLSPGRWLQEPCSRGEYLHWLPVAAADWHGNLHIPGLVNIQKNYGKSPFYSWKNSLFLWPFSIAIC